jgi:uncharacterized membrane protein
LAQNRQTDRDRIQAERDRETNARSLASMDFLAREMAAIRISLENKVDRDDLDDALTRLLNALEHAHDPTPDGSVQDQPSGVPEYEV